MGKKKEKLLKLIINGIFPKGVHISFYNNIIYEESENITWSDEEPVDEWSTLNTK